MPPSGRPPKTFLRYVAVVLPAHFAGTLLVRALRAPDGEPLSRTLATPVLLGALVGSAIFAAVLALFLAWLARRRRGESR